MLKRNISVKAAPQRWQDNASDGVFDVVLTFEEKVFDIVLEGAVFDFICILLICFSFVSSLYIELKLPIRHEHGLVRCT